MTVAHESGTEAFLLYPATLKIGTGHTTYLFSLPVDAEQFLGHLPSPCHPDDAMEDELLGEHPAPSTAGDPAECWHLAGFSLPTSKHYWL